MKAGIDLRFAAHAGSAITRMAYNRRLSVNMVTFVCGFRFNWSSDSGGNWSAIPVGSGPGFRWELVQILNVYRNGGPLAGMLDHMTGTVDQIAGIGQV
jgi:hypothetical protein